MTIRLRLQTNYGREDFYPVNDLAKAIVEMMGKKVLRNKQLKILEKHKITVEIQDEQS